MKNGVTLLFVLIILAGLFMANTSPVKAQSTNIYINPDGLLLEQITFSATETFTL